MKIQTMARAYQQICTGEADPWIALGNFRNAWYGCAKEERTDVLSYLLDLANCFQVDLEQAFRAKEEIERSMEDTIEEERSWKELLNRPMTDRRK